MLFSRMLRSCTVYCTDNIQIKNPANPVDTMKNSNYYN